MSERTCLKCGYEMLGQCPGRMEDFIHVCGGCRQMHMFENGAMRQLTKAEEFVMEMEAPKASELVKTMPTANRPIVVIPENWLKGSSS